MTVAPVENTFFIGFMVCDWSCAVEFTNHGGPTEALISVGRLIIFLILLKIGWKVSTSVRMTPVKTFLSQISTSVRMIPAKTLLSQISTSVRMIPAKTLLSQTTYSKVMIKNPNALYIGWGRIRFHVKILAVSNALETAWDPIVQHTAHGCWHSACTGENSAGITGL